MNILAIAIPHSDRHTGDCSKMSFPLGLAYIIGSIRKRVPEARITVSDLPIRKVYSRQEIEAELVRISADFHPDFVIYGGMITRLGFIKTLNEAARKVFPDAKLVLGGTAVESGHRFFLTDNVVDYLVSGEGEEAIIDILTGKAPQASGLSGGGRECALVEHAVGDIDSLPMPSYEDFQVGDYVKNNARFTGWKYMPMIAGRGCPFKCSFCYPFFGNVTRYRAEDLVIEEMEHLRDGYGIDAVYFWDDIQFLDKAWMERFCKKLIARKTGLKWSCSTRGSLLHKNDIPLLRLANRAGCLRIAVGIESGNQQILDRMNKKTSVRQTESAIKTIRDAGIKASGSMLIGYPGESPETIRDSVGFANRNLLKTSFYCLIPLPLTEIYKYCVEKGIIRDESAYLKRVSDSGGDASQLVINITDMDDRTYRDEVARANALVGRVALSDMLKYYGAGRGCMEYMKAFYGSIRLKMSGRLFDTP